MNQLPTSSPARATQTRSPAFILNLFLIILGCLALSIHSKPTLGVLFFIPFALGPLFISLILSSLANCNLSQSFLVISSILYGTWFTYVYLSAFYWHLDPQSAIAVLFIAVYSLPVMIPVWLIVLYTRTENRISKKDEQQTTTQGN